MGLYKVESSNYKAIHGKICRTHPFFPELLGVWGWEGKWYHLQSCSHHFKPSENTHSVKHGTKKHPDVR